MTPSGTANRTHAHECRIRDFYAKCIAEQRPGERVLATEHRFGTPGLRADMRTVDAENTLREWEFKIHADRRALGQVQVYLAHARLESSFTREIRAVLAAFTFEQDVRIANEVLNLGIELVTIPPWMAMAGGIPLSWVEEPQIIEIPVFASQAL